MKLLRYIIRHDKRVLAFAIMASFSTGIGSASLVALISQQMTSKLPLTFIFIGNFMGLVLLVLCLELVAKWLLIRLTARNSYHLQMHLSRQILVTPLRHLEKIGSPRLLTLLTADIKIIIQALNQIPSLCISSAILVACSVYLAWLSPFACLILFLLAVPSAFGYRMLLKKSKRFLAQAFALRDQNFDHFKALTEGTKELKLHQPRRRSFLFELLEPIATAQQNKRIIGRTWHEIATTWSQALYFVFILGLFTLAAIRNVNLDVLTGFALVALYMKAYVSRLLNALPSWSQAGIILKEIESLGFLLESTNDNDKVNLQPRQTVNTNPCLELRGVTHTYTRDLDDGHFTLGPINLRFNAGELTFLIGANGSGKTTLIKLLTSLYTPEKGQIYFNGTLITSEIYEAYRQNFSLVFSDSYLFEQLLGIEESNLDTKAYQYLVKLQLEHKINIKNGNFSTTNLSTGQRKRLALLTAYLEDRPIYIFDEWAASQDPMFREIFYRQLLPELKAKGKLIIIISHDDHYYDAADRIIKLDYGQVESDTWLK